MKKHPLSILSLAFLLATVSTLPAATLFSNVVTNIAGATDVSAEGTAVYAYNFGNTAADPVVNGVTFTGVTIIGNGLYDGTTNLSIDQGRISGINGSSTSVFGAGSTTGSYATLLQSASYRNTGSPDGYSLFSVGNLAANQTYLAQLWIHDSRAGIPRTASINAKVGTGLNSGGGLVSGITDLGVLGTIDYNITDTAGSNGQLLTFIFSTSATENALMLEMTANQNQGQQINAFQIRAIPEPASALLGGLGVLFLLRRRR